MSVQPKRSTGRDPRSILAIAAEVLLADPTASLADVAAAAGVGRTTLHHRFPTRHDLLVALAHDSLDQCAEAIDASGLVAIDEGSTPAELRAALRKLVDVLIPLGPRIALLVRQPSLDKEKDLEERLARLDAPVETFCGFAQKAGVLRSDQTVWWQVQSVYALTYLAWEGIAAGRIAPLDATELTLDTFLTGTGAR
ncbi:TetR family transcriptional regulator [Kribbella deserti]|uniref:TetR family transcriptional regulator n=1 Tax=Kribbella deserti TaxID=1926257 RepID=A0ABV6QPX7_9ACTN